MEIGKKIKYKLFDVVNYHINCEVWTHVDTNVSENVLGFVRDNIVSNWNPCIITEWDEIEVVTRFGI